MDFYTWKFFCLERSFGDIYCDPPILLLSSENVSCVFSSSTRWPKGIGKGREGEQEAPRRWGGTLDAKFYTWFSRTDVSLDTDTSAFASPTVIAINGAQNTSTFQVTPFPGLFRSAPPSHSHVQSTTYKSKDLEALYSPPGRLCVNV